MTGNCNMVIVTVTSPPVDEGTMIEDSGIRWARFP